MLPHQERVVVELAEVVAFLDTTCERLQKLVDFIASPNYTTIVPDAEERDRLEMQLEAMRECIPPVRRYVRILELRIANFGG